MLAEETIQLLTGYVDGELSSRQRKTVLRLLHASSEARELLLQLQENAHKITQLPRRKLGAGFAAEVVETIAQRCVIPERPYRPTAMRLRWLPYAIAAAAAALLFAVTLAGGLYVALFNNGPEGGPVNPVAKGDGADLPQIPVKPDPEPEPLPPPRKAPNPLIARVTEGVYQQYAAVIPPDRNPSISFAELKDNGLAAKQLVSEINKSDALQLDITVRNNPQAVDRLAAILKKYDVKLEVAPTSASMLKNAPAKAEYLVYSENLSADELTKILKELAAEDKKAKSPFDKVAVTSLSKQDHELVASRFGQDPTTRSKKDINIKGQKGPNIKGKRVAVVLPQAPESTASDEIRAFLFQRALPLDGSVRVLVRIRQE